MLHEKHAVVEDTPHANVFLHCNSVKLLQSTVVVVVVIVVVVVTSTHTPHSEHTFCAS